MKKTSKKYKKFLETRILDYEAANRASPFPFYDTELVYELKNELKRVMAEDKKYYDSLPVACCKHCKELRLKIDSLENDVCLRCGAQGNDIAEIYKDIFEYSKVTGKKIE